MSLRFPNESRSYDPTRRAVRFWGHDSAMEASFFVSEDALKRVQPDMLFDEAGLLGAFDANRDLICAPAANGGRLGRPSNPVQRLAERQSLSTTAPSYVSSPT